MFGFREGAASEGLRHFTLSHTAKWSRRLERGPVFLLPRISDISRLILRNPVFTPTATFLDRRPTAKPEQRETTSARVSSLQASSLTSEGPSGLDPVSGDPPPLVLLDAASGVDRRLA